MVVNHVWANIMQLKNYKLNYNLTLYSLKVGEYL